MEKHTQFRDMMGVVSIDMIVEKHEEKNIEDDLKKG